MVVTVQTREGVYPDPFNVHQRSQREEGDSILYDAPRRKDIYTSIKQKWKKGREIGGEETKVNEEK